MGYSKRSILMMMLLSLGAVLTTFWIFHRDQHFEGIPVMIVDEDESRFSEQVIRLLEDEDYLNISTGTFIEGQDMLRRNRVEGVYRIHEGFEESILSDRIPTITAYTPSGALGTGAIGEILSSRGIRLMASTRAANIVVREDLRATDSEEEREALWSRTFQQAEGYWEPEPLMTLKVNELHPLGTDDGAVQGDERPGGARQIGLLSGPEGLLITFLSFLSAGIFYHRKKEWDSGVLPREVLILGEGRLFLKGMISDFALIYSLSAGTFLLYGLFPGTFPVMDLIPVLLLLAMFSLLWMGAWKVLIPLKINHQTGWIAVPVGILLTSIIGGGIWSPEVFPEQLRRLTRFTPQGFFLEGYAKLGIKAYMEMIPLVTVGLVIILLLIGLGFRSYKKITLP